MEEKKKYLYGASVQGIQAYVFQTNRLQDIVGASELVRKICTELFEDTVGKEAFKHENLLIAAAGNVKYEFDNRQECERVVRNFPKKVLDAAPGVTISQAVVEYADDNEYPSKVEELERNLRIQRNRQMKSTTVGHIGILRSRSTGMPVAGKQDGEYLDEATMKKRAENTGSKARLCEEAFGSNVASRYFAYNVEDMCDKNNWIAIIHADGNGLGKIVQRIGTDKRRYKEFSHSLEEATKAAAQAAFGDIMSEEMWNKTIPIRPIVLGGDDFTVVCRGSIAMKFVASYLCHFEESTERITGRKLTACAGIAFIKSSYPFYYGYNMAESLCEEAKKDANREENKDRDGTVRSCVMFHKVQDSFVADFAEIEKRELAPAKGWSYRYGPYYLNPPKSGMITLQELLEYPEKLQGKEGNALKSGLRKWMTCLAAGGEDAAEQLRKRISQITQKKLKDEVLDRLLESDKKTTPVYDVLSLCSIMYKETNKKYEL